MLLGALYLGQTRIAEVSLKTFQYCCMFRDRFCPLESRESRQMEFGTPYFAARDSNVGFGPTMEVSRRLHMPEMSDCLRLAILAFSRNGPFWR